MTVHLQTRSGSEETIECGAIWEADNDLYLMEAASQKPDFAIGYVPFERLDHVEPGKE